MGDTTGLSNSEAKDLCKPPDEETKVSLVFYSATEMELSENKGLNIY
jgi:hypothetical protein